MPIHLRLLNLPLLRLDDGRVMMLPPNDAALLAVLAIDGPTSREAMAALLWPDAPGEGARSNLRQRLSQFKKRAGLVLQQTGGGLLELPPSPTADTPVPGSTSLTHDLDGLAERLQSDPAADSGELLGTMNFDDNPRLAQWLQRTRHHWRGGRLEAMAAIAERLEREHRIAEALPYASRIAQDETLAEHAHRRVMRLHYLRGDRSAALAAYDRLRTVLRDELATIPSRETLELARLIDSSAVTPGTPAPAARLVTVLRPPQLVGRDTPLAQALGAWAEGEHLLVCGEAGIGKSRFIDEMAGRLGISLRTQARQGDSGVPYALLSRLLRAALPGDEPAAGLPAWASAELARIAPAFGSPAGGAPSAVRVAEAARLAIDSHTALCIDDLQYADTATLELLPTLVSRPLQCLFAVRSEEMPPSVDDWRRGGTDRPVQQVQLGPLDAAGVETLLQSLALPSLDSARWQGVLLQHTGGHPLFLLETVRELLRGGGVGLGAAAIAGTVLRLPLPAEVARLIERRFDALSPAALKLMRIAALAGQDYAPDMAVAVLSIDLLALAEPWSELAAAHLFGDAGFAHDLVQETAARSVPGAIAVALHHAIADVLERRIDPAAARIAAHWLQARQWPAAARQFERAAAMARAAGRPVEELALNEQAASCFERAGDVAGRFRVRVATVEPAIVVESIGRALARAHDLVNEAVNDRQRLDALLAKAKCDGTNANHDGSSAELALELARRLDDPRDQLLAAGLLAVARSRQGNVGEAIDLLEAHAAIAKLTDDDVHTEFLGVYGMSLFQGGRIAEAFAMYQRASRLSEGAGLLNDAMINQISVASCQAIMGDTIGAVDSGERAMALWVRQGEPGGIPGGSTLMNLGNVFTRAGRASRAIDCLERALSMFDKNDAANWSAGTEHVLATVYMRLGQPERAERLLSPQLDMALSPDICSRRLVLRCQLALRSGGCVSAEWLAELQTSRTGLGDYARLPTRLTLGAALPSEQALRVFEDIIAAADPSWVPLVLAARIRAADALRRLGRNDDALALARVAADPMSASKAATDMEAAERWWLLYLIFIEAGAGDEAEQALRHAVSAIEAELPYVPKPFRDSFLHRNPYSSNVLAEANKRSMR